LSNHNPPPRYFTAIFNSTTVKMSASLKDDNIPSIHTIATCLKAMCTTVQIARLFAETAVTKQRRLSHNKHTDATIGILDDALGHGLMSNQLPYAKTVFQYQEHYRVFVDYVNTELSDDARTAMYKNKSVYIPNSASVTQRDRRLDELYYAVLNISRTMENDVPVEFKTSDINTYEKQLEEHWSPAYFDNHATAIRQHLVDIQQLQTTPVVISSDPPPKRHKRKQSNPQRRIIKPRISAVDKLNELLNDNNTLQDDQTIPVSVEWINKISDAILSIHPNRQNRLRAVLDGWNVSERGDKLVIVSCSKPKQQYKCRLDSQMYTDCMLCVVLVAAKSANTLIVSDIKKLARRLEESGP